MNRFNPHLPRLPRLPLAAFRRRALLRAVFLALLAGSAFLVLQLLTDERQRLQRAYEAGFRGQLDVLAERLRHPSGQLALRNADRPADTAQGSVPLRLPFGAIDFDDPAKAERAVEMSGCAQRHADGSEACIAVGQRASAGAFVYAVVRLQAGPLLGRTPGQTALDEVHRAQVLLTHAGQRQRWLAPLELLSERRGQLAGFATDADALDPRARPDRDFRGWLWQEPACVQDGDDPTTCARRTLLTLRVPVAAWREAARAGAAWPPADLPQLRVAVQLLGPDPQRGLLFDSLRPGASPAPGVQDLAASLQAGELLTVFAAQGEAPIARVQGPAPAGQAAYPWLTRLIRRLPAARLEGPLQAEATLPSGHRLRLEGDLKSVDRTLSATATRYAGYFGGLAGAIALAWLIVEIGLLRRMAQLTRRANALTLQLQRAPDQLPPLDVDDLKGRDELGILAGTLSELLGRAREHLRGEQLRAHQEREQWQAVGHEIMSPLQSLLALHGAEDDASRRYLLRMQAALNLLYGQASVGEALTQAQVQRERLDLADFLRQVAANAPYAGIEQVVAEGCEAPCEVLADALKLEDALTHLLTNAQRYRVAGTPIVLRLSTTEDSALVEVHNQGPTIDPARLATLFELGAGDAEGPTHRGQGLFIARGYLAKMGGAIAVRNADGGVIFTLSLPRAT
ncbi:sensor histidine kinase [Inhella crocodyli]|uniref:histidine kinase n=1 Tax=Inhella crocodyli TaxID=2499851 RepID=A0A437LI45_9BURK|nr:HAMP domain-containing sensor histidine kinase [Inhella crocodyli]RVT85004.1 HAMP domain-containing histidine kinase [Inhella crocodyli]